MIPPEQLAGALERLDPRERELLALSLRRRVPDEALARVYDVDSQEVARRRAAAIERLADELGAQRGEDLGAVLQALLDQGTWEALDPSSGNGEVGEAEEAEPLAAPSPVAVEEERQAPVVPVPSEPVLEMLAAREGLRAPAAAAESNGAGTRRRTSLVAVILGSFVAAVIGGAAAFVGFTEWDGDGPGSAVAAGDDGTRHFIPALGGPIEAPFPSEPQPISCYSTAAVTDRVPLYREPGRRVRIRLSPRTEWGSPRVLGVVRRRGDWISVQAPELDNGEVAWMEASRARLDCVRWSMHADLSRRTLSIRRDGEAVRQFEIAVGREENPTPRGRFSVTDKLRVRRPGIAVRVLRARRDGTPDAPARELAGRRPPRGPRDEGAVEHRRSRPASGASGSRPRRRAG